MPEVWVVLDKDNLPFDDYLDMRSVYEEENFMNKITAELNIKTIAEFVGTPQSDWEEMEEYLVEIGQKTAPEPWTPDKQPWFEADYGIHWCTRILDHLANAEDSFSEDRDSEAAVIEDLNELRNILQQAKLFQAKWSLQLGF